MHDKKYLKQFGSQGPFRYLLKNLVFVGRLQEFIMFIMVYHLPHHCFLRFQNFIIFHRLIRLIISFGGSRTVSFCLSRLPFAGPCRLFSPSLYLSLSRSHASLSLPLSLSMIVCRSLSLSLSLSRRPSCSFACFVFLPASIAFSCIPTSLPLSVSLSLSLSLSFTLYLLLFLSGSLSLSLSLFISLVGWKSGLWIGRLYDIE